MRYKEILDYFGVDKQIKKLAEETYELEEAMIHHELKSSVEYEIPLTEIIGTS